MNKVFIATSIDGYIADSEGGIDWLNSIPNPNNDDMGYNDFMNSIDALIMGRITFETVCSFDIEWPYEKPVFVLSNSLKSIPKEYEGKVFLVQGGLKDVVDEVKKKGYNNLYIDGGKTIQSFLKEDLIDEMTISIIPIVLGNGIPLFGAQSKSLKFECISSKIYLNKIVQNVFSRSKD